MIGYFNEQSRDENASYIFWLHQFHNSHRFSTNFIDFPYSLLALPHYLGQSI